jgi:hypothetical protein
LLTALLLLACARPLPAGSEADEQWLLRASEVDAPLAAPCVGAAGGDGPYEVWIDDRTGWTALSEPGEGRVWLREPFGTIPDRCWWLPPQGQSELDLPDQDCVSGRQDGTCGPDADVPAEAVFLSPGVALTGPTRTTAVVDGVLLATSDEGLLRLDLTPDSDPPVDPSEDLRTWLRWLPALETEADAVAAGTALVLWDEDRGRVEFHPRAEGRRTLEEPIRRRDAPHGPGVLAAAGDVAAVVTDGRIVVWDGIADRAKRDRRDHPALSGFAGAAVVDPETGFVYALVEGGVIGLGPTRDDLSFHPTPGAQGLFLGRPAGVPTVYAWGNDADGNGVLWRLEPGNTAVAHHLDEPLLGSGTGDQFQEIVLVTRGPDGPHATGWLDRAHLEALPAGSVGVAMVPFVESPRDTDLRDVAGALGQVGEVGGCATEAPEGFEEEHALCCAQQIRGEQAARQLDWLGDRLDPTWPGGPAAVVLGVNPTAIVASRLCERVPDPTISAMGTGLPTVVASWLQEHEDRVTAAVFLHSAAYDADSFWTTCPGAWPGDPPDACWDVEQNEQTLSAFLDEVSAAASLGDWGEEPDWTLLGGGFEEARAEGVSWPDVLGGVELPDGSGPEDGLFFGNLSMDPNAPAALAKELAPADAPSRPFPVDVHTPSDRWDGGGTPTGDVYRPGQTFALTYLYESRRSGLLLIDWIGLASPGADWASEPYRGDEHTDVMNHADFALEEHYLVTRVLAHRDVEAPRWWYFHLQDLTRVRATGVEAGWIDCVGDCATDSELDRFLLRLEAWQPAVEWRARP